MTYGGSEFIKMIQTNNMYILLLVLGRGQDKPAWTACPPGGEDNQGGGQDIPGQLAPQGASCPGGQDKLLHRNVSSWVEGLMCLAQGHKAVPSPGLV